MAIQVEITGYDSLEQIGVGGMAAVYRARKVSIDKTVAIKVLFPYLATDESYIERFHREAKAAARIQHENIVNVIDFGESEGAFYIVMEYYDGCTLEHLMKERPGVPTDIAVQILLEVAYGLEAAHSLDIVHRDIKPANIIYTNQGGIKIADFGLARKSDSMTMITQQGKVIGTPAYMSPEQAAGRPVGPASDLFSLGVVAYELLSRRKPFEGKSYSEVLEKIQTCEPVSLGNANPLITPEFECIVMRMLAKDDRERCPSATALITELEAAMEKNKISRDRRRLTSYIKDPAAYEAAYNEKMIAQCLSRGAFFMHKGQDHLEDAATEFRRILYLDPGNERARRNLDQIHAERGDRQRTVTIDALQAVPAPPAQDVPERPIGPRSPRRGAPRWVWGAGLVVVSAAVAAVMGWPSRDATREVVPTESPLPAATRAADASHMVGPRADSSLAFLRGASSSEDAPGARAGEESAASAETTAHEPPPTMSASVSPALEGKEGGPGVPVRSPGREAESRQSSPVETVASSKGTDGPKRSAPAPVEKRTGTLSVFFLGGVGELWVDGRPFAHQPPFEGVALATGTYRVACRMSGDATPRNLAVTIQPGAETVIEYELGGEPVVTTTK